MCVCGGGGWEWRVGLAIIREGAALSPALGFEVLEVQPEAWLGTCTSILSTRMPGPPSFSGFLSSYLLTIVSLYSVSMAMSLPRGPWSCWGERWKRARAGGRVCPRASSEQ